MIGRTKLSTIREELRKAHAAEGVNPIIELDCKIRDLKKAKSGKDEVVLKKLETFREALAEIVEEPKKPASPNRRAERKRLSEPTGRGWHFARISAGVLPKCC